MIISGEAAARFVGERVGQIIYPPFTAIGIERDGEIVAGAVFNCYTGTDIHVTVAIDDRRAAGALTRQTGRYVFDQLKCERITVITEKPKVVSYAERLGAVREGVLRNQFGKGRDGYLLGLLREDWPL